MLLPSLRALLLTFHMLFILMLRFSLDADVYATLYMPTCFFHYAAIIATLSLIMILPAAAFADVVDVTTSLIIFAADTLLHTLIHALTLPLDAIAFLLIVAMLRFRCRYFSFR